MWKLVRRPGTPSHPVAEINSSPTGISKNNPSSMHCIIIHSSVKCQRFGMDPTCEWTLSYLVAKSKGKMINKGAGLYQAVLLVAIDMLLIIPQCLPI